MQKWKTESTSRTQLQPKLEKEKGKSYYKNSLHHIEDTFALYMMMMKNLEKLQIFSQNESKNCSQTRAT